MPAILPPEVPAYVRHESHVSNHVSVQGGSNWDFSRSAVATPISAVQDPQPTGLSEVTALAPEFQPNPALPATPAVANVKFAYKSVVLPVSMQTLLKSLPKDPAYLVAGYADAKEPKAASLSARRAKAVASYLKKRGNRVAEESSYGAQHPRASAGASENRRVEVFVNPSTP
jgi:hypothetical protein